MRGKHFTRLNLWALKPTSGQILVDEIDINSKKIIGNLKSDTRSSDIYLLDDTIKSNIAFGIDDESFLPSI